jgi:hypothetical protein
MTFTELINFLDVQTETHVMQAVGSMYENGARGLFCEKFIPYKDFTMLGYAGVKRFLTSMYEIDEFFMLTYKGELANLKSQIQRQKGIYDNEH